MPKYHVNPITGEPGRCRAIFRCRFTHPENHFDTEAEARSAYEEVRSGQLFGALSKAVKDEGFYTEDKLLELHELFVKKTTHKLDYDGISFEDGRAGRFSKLYREILMDYKIALDIYANEEQSAIVNSLLRGDKATFKKVRELGLLENYKDAITYLDYFIKQNSKAQKTPLYKGVTVSSQLEYDAMLSKLEELKPGDELSFDTYFSTSVSFDAARNFSYGDKTVVYEIVNAKGSYINHPVEEVLLPRNSKFRFLSFEESHDIIDHLIIRLAQE